MPLSNDYKDCLVFDLDPADRRTGPFIVTQAYIAPDDPMQTEHLYLLRRDGVWVRFLTQSLHHPEDRIAITFDYLGDVITLLQSLPVAAQVETKPVSTEQQAGFQRQVEAAGGLLAFIEQTVIELRRATPAKAG